MKLSQAIRIGAARRPQGFGEYFSYSTSGDALTSSCALGAALDGLGHADCTAAEAVAVLAEFTELWEQVDPAVLDRFTEKHGGGSREVASQGVGHPNDFTVRSSLTLNEQIELWNDDLRLSREEIADLIES